MSAYLRGLVLVVGQFNVGPELQQFVHRVQIALLGRQEERRLAGLVLQVHLAALPVAYHLDRLGVVHGGGPMQRRLALIVGQIHVHRVRETHQVGHQF